MQCPPCPRWCYSSHITTTLSPAPATSLTTKTHPSYPPCPAFSTLPSVGPRSASGSCGSRLGLPTTASSCTRRRSSPRMGGAAWGAFVYVYVCVCIDGSMGRIATDRPVIQPTTHNIQQRRRQWWWAAAIRLPSPFVVGGRRRCAFFFFKLYMYMCAGEEELYIYIPSTTPTREHTITTPNFIHPSHSLSYVHTITTPNHIRLLPDPLTDPANA